MTALATQLDPKLTSHTTATAARPNAGFNNVVPFASLLAARHVHTSGAANVAEEPPIERPDLGMTALTAPESSAPDVSPGGSALHSTAPRHDAGVARTYGHPRECRRQHAVRADKDLARNGSNLHKWEFLHLLQLPRVNW
jgi:hypothetical protein